MAFKNHFDSHTSYTTASNFLWVIPFLSFIAGYYALHLLYTIPELETPCVVGKQLPEAVRLLSDHNLNARLIAQKEDPDLPDYTIVSQTPREHSRIKAHQSVFLVLTRQPEKPCAPHVIGESSNSISQKLAHQHIRHKCYTTSSNHPKDTCIAQFPRPKERLDDNFLICYISKGNKKPVIFPDLRGKTVENIREFLDTHELIAEIIGKPKNESSALIQEQRPLPGSIIILDGNNRPNVQLHVK